MHPSVELRSRTVSFRPDLNVLVVRWHTLMPLEIVQADYARILEMAAAHEASHWLLDVRRRDKARPELVTWLTQTFYPQAAARLAPRRLRLAVLNSPALSRAQQADAEQKQHIARHQRPNEVVELRMFEDEGEAMQWLSTGHSGS